MEHASSGSLGIAIITGVGAFIGALISHLLTQRRSLDLAIYKHRGEAYKGYGKKHFFFPDGPHGQVLPTRNSELSVRNFAIGTISSVAFISAIPPEMPMVIFKKR